jgi:hypothetical protein
LISRLVPSVAALVTPVCRKVSTAGHQVWISSARVCTSGTLMVAHQV